MEHEFESAPRDNTRRTIVVRSIKISGLSVEATLRWLRNVLSEAHTRVRGSCCVALHRGRRRSRVTALTLRSQQAATLPMWRPTRRVDARRYVKDQSPPWKERGNYTLSCRGMQGVDEKGQNRNSNGQDARYPCEPPRWRLPM